MKYLVILSAVLLTQEYAEIDNSLRLLSRYYNHSNAADFFSTTPADEAELIHVNDCDFEDDSMEFKQVACNLIIHVTDVADQNIEYRNYLHVTFILEVLESFNIYTKYLGMTGIQVRKMHDVQDGSNIYKMGNMEITELLNGIAQLEATLQLADPLPAGISTRASTGGRSVMMVPWFLPGSSITTVDAYLLNFFSGKMMNLSILYNEFGGYSGRKILPYIHTTSLEYLKLNRAILGHSLLLSYQPYLINLNVADCSIELIPDETFYATPNLKHLNLADNLLNTIPPSISTLVHLETLDLSHNPLITEEMSFTLPLHQLEHLQILQLCHIPLNNLDLLQPFLFSTAVRLSELYLANCNISVMADDEISILEHQTSLKVLDMSNNKLKYIPSNFVQSVKKLMVLNLSSNHLYESPQLILGSNLTTLDLSYNNLTVPVNITHLGTVELLNLSRNKISTWSNLATSLSTKVKCLNVSHNFIEVVSKEMIDFFKTMQSVDLGGNPLNCQICDILELKDWYRQEDTTTRVLNFNTSESLSCSVNLKVVDVGLPFHYCADEAVAVAALQIAMVFSMVILVGVLMWGYKFEVSYFSHLLEVKCDWLARQSRTFQFDAFICCSEADRGFVLRELVQHLENGPEKYKLCLEDRNFVLGRFITQNIMNFLQESRKVIVVITSNFINNQWCNWELEMVKHKLFEDEGDFLIFLDLGHVKMHTLPRHLRYLMSTQTYIKWPSPSIAEAETWTRLKTKLGDSLYMKKHGIINA